MHHRANRGRHARAISYIQLEEADWSRGTATEAATAAAEGLKDQSGMPPPP